MKKKLFCSLVAVSMLQAISVEAQSTDKWNGSVEFNPVFSTAKGSDATFNINLTATRKVDDYLGVGLGIGVNESFKFNSSPSIPIFARFHAEDFSRKMSPFMTMDIGYGINTSNIDNGCLIINPTVGLRYGAFSLGLGYYGSKSFISGSKMMSAINLRLGYNFGYHRSTSPFANALRNVLRKLEFSIDLGARMPIGANSGDYAEYKNYDSWLGFHNYEWRYNWKSKYSVAPDITMALLYPVTNNFYAGLMAGFNLILNKHEVYDGYQIFYNGPGVVKSEKPIDNFSETLTQSSVQIALRMKYKLKELMFAKRFYPYAQVDLGYDVNYDVEPGFFYAPSVGISMDIANGNHSLDLGVSYVSQKLVKIDYPYTINSIASSWSYEEYKNSGAIRISLGYTF